MGSRWRLWKWRVFRVLRVVPALQWTSNGNGAIESENFEDAEQNITIFCGKNELANGRRTWAACISDREANESLGRKSANNHGERPRCTISTNARLGCINRERVQDRLSKGVWLVGCVSRFLR